MCVTYYGKEKTLVEFKSPSEVVNIAAPKVIHSCVGDDLTNKSLYIGGQDEK